MTVTNDKIYYNVRPVVIISAGFLLGILSAYFFVVNKIALSLITLSVMLVVLTVLICVFWFRKNSKIILVLFILIATVLGFLYSVFRGVSIVEVPLGKQVEYDCVVSEISLEEISDGAYDYKVVLKGKTGGTTVKTSANLTLNERIYVGTKLQLTAEFYKKEVDKFSLSSGVFYGVKNIESVSINGISGATENLKFRLLTALENTMPNAYGVNYALLTGDTQYISEDLLLKYRETGIAHIFAVSGLHIGLMFALISGLFKLLKTKRLTKFIITSLILLLYLGFCGFSPSSMRAFIIIFIIMFADLFGFKPDSSSSVFLSAIVVLLINPFDFLNAGFILSFSIYLALTVMAKPFAKILSKIFPQKFASVLSPYLVAHLVSFPISLSLFSYAQPLSFALNIIVIPLISFFYAFSLIGGVLLLIFPSVSLFSIVPEIFLTLVNGVVLSLNTKTFLLSNINLSWALPSYYAYLYLLCGKVNINAKILRLLRIIFLVATILIVIFLNIIT